jgi:hypothetical protein
MKRKKSEQLIGITPEELTNCRAYFNTYKSAKKGQNSFRITKNLLDNLLSTANKIQKQPKLIISIPDGLDEYTLSCILTKNKGQ